MTTIHAEFERLSRVFDRIGFPLKTAPPASNTQIDTLTEVTGITVCDDLKDLWQLSNGSRKYFWLADGEDEEFTPHAFLSIKEVISQWKLFAPYDQALYSQWHDNESWGERDPRIQRYFLRHRKWLAFTNSYGSNQQLYFDADPTQQGTYGQMIMFVHDPDGVYWSGKSFLSFFKRSNDLLEALSDAPELLVERLELEDSVNSLGPGLRAPDTCHEVEFDFNGIRVTWMESVKGRASTSESLPKHPNPLENSYRVIDLPFILKIHHGNLLFEDDGLEFDFGSIKGRDHIRVAGYNKIFVNGELRKPHTDT
ncbi:SMI1/KNR4 family protein [Bremerella alba]|uniref:Knr4/Smi1-like domain-containing protein n=1 Tax=Bremerella alba TaxID=980252 RepID=A0A7V9A6Z6_9BACT|nr:SMI1/KNR4 family protein [Bremerella alba]MBA2114890.1 hypothetical protein [Bremerella alba]